MSKPRDKPGFFVNNDHKYANDVFFMISFMIMFMIKKRGGISMGFMKKILLSLVLVFSTLTIATPTVTPIIEVSAATVKLNKTSVTITKGKTYTLKVSGTKKTVKWSTSNKKVATVSSKGKVTAKKAGTTYIYAKVNGKTLRCKVTVKNISSSVYITRYGSKYHRKSNCGNSKYMTKVSLSTAKQRGYSPCKKCY